MTQKLGTLLSLFRYPVKSMGAQKLDEAYVTPNGIVGDHTFGFRIEGHPSPKSSKSFLTARVAPGLVGCKPEFVNDPGVDMPWAPGYRPEVKVTLPDGATISLHDPRLTEHLERTYSEHLDGRDLVLQRQDGYKIFDKSPLSLIGMPSIDGVSSELGNVVNPLCFRMNMYVAWEKSEDLDHHLVGRVIRIGPNLQVKIEEKTTRCVMANIDPATGLADGRILDTIGTLYKGRLGVYASVMQPGLASAGDEIYVVS